jgi:hypothetical protein
LEEEERDTTNDLKRLFGQIPNLSILIDEVHHAATDDIKLRQAVNYWHEKGNITTVLGFSGTPYLPGAETIKTGSYAFKFSQITNTVYYYPLITAIRKFLKTPTIKTGYNLDRFGIIKQGIESFDSLYKTKVYDNGAIAKLAIYCSSIAVLEEQVYPFLVGELKIAPTEILKYHGGNTDYPLPKENEKEFRSLDYPISKKRYILLVQIGKEGWDCRSLTGVILSQKGDSPQTMVLQTSCRCLRQVDKEKDETALIWLNKDNAETLEKQLKLEQNSSIDEINNAKRAGGPGMVQRYSRIEYLQLPLVEFYQMKINYQSINEEQTANTRIKLKSLSDKLTDYKKSVIIRTGDIANLDTGNIDTINESGIDFANYSQWLFEIARQSFGLIKKALLEEFNTDIKKIFDAIVYENNGQLFFNDQYDRYLIESQIRIAFSIKRRLETESEVVPKEAELLIAGKLGPAEKNEMLYPDEADTTKILSLDNSNDSVDVDFSEVEKAYQLAKEALEGQGIGHMMPDYDSFKANKEYSLPVKSKNHSFHYLPYNFGGSGSSRLEMDTFKTALQLADFKTKGLEIYYNGERGLSEFVIDCYARENVYWKNIGKYTTDFLVIKRSAENKIHKVLLVETKGGLYAADQVFQKKKAYIENDFLRLNQEKFGYKRFDFLYLQESEDAPAGIAKLGQKLNQFFND